MAPIAPRARSRPRRRFLAALLAALWLVLPADAQEGIADHVSVGDLPPLPLADDGPAFRDIRDATGIRFAETAAYAVLLDRARSTSTDQFDAEARTDVVFSHLLENPERYRGLPIRLRGTARRVLRLEDIPEALVPEGYLYEAWTFTADSRGYPYVLVFEDPPADFPIGDDVEAPILFRGNFFKLLAYNAGDKPRKAPLLIGRVEYLPDASANAALPGPVGRGSSRGLWMLAPIALLAAYLVARLTTTTRRLLGRSSFRRRDGLPPRDAISPEELDDWLRRDAEDDKDRDR